jgi:DNA-binding MarR family transcriptional regulator
MQNKKSIIEHGILELIDQNGRVTQTQLASDLSISLGLLNAYIKRLIKKGYIKTANFKASNIKYLLTAEGLALKYKLTRSFMERSLEYYRGLKKAVESRITRLKMQEVRTVVFVVSGEVAEIQYLYLKGTRIELVAIFDFNVTENTKFFEYEVKPVSELKSFVLEHKVDKILLNVFDDVEKLEDNLFKIGIEKNKIEKDW